MLARAWQLGRPGAPGPGTRGRYMPMVITTPSESAETSTFPARGLVNRELAIDIFARQRARSSSIYTGMKYLAYYALVTGLLTNWAALGAAGPARGRGQADHVVVVVWDGMRPDMITREHTPTLHQLASEGVFFANHHPAFISSTEVNGTAMATGAHPQRSGIIANNDYRPAMNWLEAVATESVDVIRRGDVLTGGHYLTMPTVAETLHQAGIPTIIAGTKPVVLLHDRAMRRTTAAARESVVLYKGHALPSRALAAVVQTNGAAFPASATPNFARDRWTTRGLTEALWRKGVPKYSLLWLSEPDASQHATAPGSTNALAAMRSSDTNLALVLAALDAKGLRQKTDVFVVSDHAFSTIHRGADIASLLRKAGFKAAKAYLDPEPGDVLVVGLGGAAMLYVAERDEAVIKQLARFLQTSDFAGVIFSRLPLPGTFLLEQGLINSDQAKPDLVVSMRWSAGTNAFGVPGLLVGESGTKGAGTHGSLSPYDMRNTLVAAGPDLRRGFVDSLPTGNADLAPTILWLLGVEPSRPMDGRVLTEAFTGATQPAVQPATRTIEATCDVGNKRWRQYLRLTTLGTQTYFDEGNGESVAAH